MVERELLQETITALEAGRPLGQRRSEPWWEVEAASHEGLRLDAPLDGGGPAWKQLLELAWIQAIAVSDYRKGGEGFFRVPIAAPVSSLPTPLSALAPWLYPYEIGAFFPEPVRRGIATVAIFALRRADILRGCPLRP